MLGECDSFRVTKREKWLEREGAVDYLNGNQLPGCEAAL